LLAIAVTLGCAALAALLVATSPRLEPAPREATQRTVRVLEARPQRIQLRVRSQGTVVPAVESALVPEISGRVIWVSEALVTGGYFEAGEPLLRVERADHEAAARRARAAVIRAEAEHLHARRTLGRRRNLATNAILSDAQLEDAERTERTSFAGLEEARVALELAERDLARTEIAAPFAGRVRDEHVDLGHFIERGQVIGNLYGIDHAEVRLPVPDSELQYLDLALSGPAEAAELQGPAVVLSATFGGSRHSWDGRIVRTEGQIDPRTRQVHVVARVEDPYGRRSSGSKPPLGAGLFVQAEIAGRTVDGVVTLPRSALLDPEHVLVVDTAERLRRRRVELLRVDGDHALVRSGLVAGERVCVSDVPVFVDGMAVHPMAVSNGNPS
jgi:RND family efflux transporter MFP subunit